MIETNPDKVKKLKAFLSRRHPDYDELLPHWEFLKACYDGGREWFEHNIFEYFKEGTQEFAERRSRAYRFNHTREVVDLVDKYLFKMQISRSVDDVNDEIKRFWENVGIDNLSIDDFMKHVSNLTSIYGRIWIVVDSNKDESVITIADEKNSNSKIYAYTVQPQSALDMSYDEKMELNWILIHEQGRDDEDPIESSGEIVNRYRLWERDQWTLFTLKRNSKPGPAKINAEEALRAIAAKTEGSVVAEGFFDKQRKVEVSKLTMDHFDIDVEGPIPHGLGIVPVFSADNVIGHDPYSATALIDDVAYLDRAVANYLSNLDAIIQDQTFSQLVMPAQGVTSGDSTYKTLIEMGTKRIFTYDAQGGGAPGYISPDVKQAEIILKVINKIINEIYHSVGLAGERTKEDNALGIDNSSGVAKAYDFERVNSLLASKADSLELTENRLTNLVNLWAGKPMSSERLVEYPNNFDVRGLYDEFEIASSLSNIGAPDTIRREQMNSLVDKLFPKIAKELKGKMLAEIKDWSPTTLANTAVTQANVPGNPVSNNAANKDNAVQQNSAQ
jgi:hypothetical protein